MPASAASARRLCGRSEVLGVNNPPLRRQPQPGIPGTRHLHALPPIATTVPAGELRPIPALHAHENVSLCLWKNLGHSQSVPEDESHSKGHVRRGGWMAPDEENDGPAWAEGRGMVGAGRAARCRRTRRPPSPLQLHRDNAIQPPSCIPCSMRNTLEINAHRALWLGEAVERARRETIIGIPRLPPGLPLIPADPPAGRSFRAHHAMGRRSTSALPPSLLSWQFGKLLCQRNHLES